MNFFLDTSILYEMIKHDEKEFISKLSRLAPGKRYATHYSAIEFNRGLVSTLIEFYCLIDELKDVSAATFKFSERYGRASNKGMIAYGYILRMAEKIDSDYRIFLGQLEFAILDICDKVDQLIKDFIGKFHGHSLGKIFSSGPENYRDFLELCKADGGVDLHGFWLGNDKALINIYEGLTVNKITRKDQFELLNFVTELLSNEEQIKYGQTDDLVISIEAPKSQTIVSKDSSFDLFSPLLGKQLIKWPASE